MDASAIALLLASILIVGVVLWLLFSRGSEKHEVARSAEGAFELLLEGRKREAREVMARLIREGRAAPSVYLRMGNLLREEGDPERALRLHQGLLARPRLSADLRRLAELAVADDLLALERWEEVARRLEALDRRILDADLLERYAQALHRLGRREHAARRLEERARLAGGATRRQAAAYLAEVAREELRASHPENAGDLLRRSFKLDETLAAAYEVDGDRYMALGRPDRAVKSWEEGLRRSRSGARPFLPRLADAALRAGKMETLLDELERERQQRPDDAALWRAVADLRLRRGDLESFMALVEDPPRADAADLSAWAGWIRYLSRAGNNEVLLRIVRSMPDAFGARLYRCPRCGWEDPEPRQACMHCGGLEPLVPAPEAGAKIPIEGKETK